MKARTTKLTVAIISAIVGSLALAGCNAMEGLGEDVEDLGDSIEEEAQEHS